MLFPQAYSMRRQNSLSISTVKILRPPCSASWILPLLLLLAMSSGVQAQFNYTTNNGIITFNLRLTLQNGAKGFPSASKELPSGG